MKLIFRMFQFEALKAYSTLTKWHLGDQYVGGTIMDYLIYYYGQNEVYFFVCSCIKTWTRAKIF